MKYITRLSEADKAALVDLMKNSFNYNVRRRAHVIILSAKKYNLNQLSIIYDVDRDTISKWLDRWDIDGVQGLIDNKRTGRPKKKKSEDSEDE